VVNVDGQKQHAFHAGDRQTDRRVNKQMNVAFAAWA